MPDTGWVNLTTFATGGGTGVAWASPSNAELSDNVYSTASLSSTSSETLNATGLSSGVPAGSIISGVEVRVERKANTTGVVDLTISLIKAGVISGDNKSGGASWPASDTYSSFGSSSDKWGLTLSASEVNSSDFGFCVAANTSSAGRIASVDHMQMKIHYSEQTANFFAFF